MGNIFSRAVVAVVFIIKNIKSLIRFFDVGGNEIESILLNMQG